MGNPWQKFETFSFIWILEDWILTGFLIFRPQILKVQKNVLILFWRKGTLGVSLHVRVWPMRAPEITVLTNKGFENKGQSFVIKLIKFKSLRVSRSLNWHILDKILAKQSFKDIIQISKFVELAFILRKTCVKIFCMNTLPDTLAKQGDLSQNGKSISSEVLFWNKP